MAKTARESKPRGSKFTPDPGFHTIGPFTWKDQSKWEAGIQPLTARIAAQKSIKSPGTRKSAPKAKPRPKGGAFGGH